MKKLSKLKLFGFVFILIGALIFIGISSLEATKPDKPGKKPGPEYTWQVVIPGANVVIPGTSERYNLFGLTPDSITYPNGVHYIYEDKELGDGFYVEVKKKGGRKGAESQFRLAVFNNIGEFGQCVPWPDGPKKIGFQEIGVTDVWFAPTAEEEYPCFFPPAYPAYPCEDPYCGAPQCMADFLNGRHPYCDPLCGHPECSYEYVDIIITVNCNFEDLVPGVPVQPSGDVQIRVVNTYKLQTGCEYSHNISSHLPEQFYEGAITIVKLDDADVDAWEITVNALITFAEIYMGTWRNRWENKIPYWAQIPLVFKTTWIRKEVTADS